MNSAMKKSPDFSLCYEKQLMALSRTEPARRLQPGASASCTTEWSRMEKGLPAPRQVPGQLWDSLELITSLGGGDDKVFSDTIPLLLRGLPWGRVL